MRSPGSDANTYEPARRSLDMSAARATGKLGPVILEE